MHLKDSKRVLQRSSLFQDLNDVHLNLILMVCEEISYLSGEYIFHQDDPGDAMYLVANGITEVVLEPEESKHPLSIATLGPDSTFGEVTLVEEGLRTASIRCQTDAQLLRIPRERMLRLCRNYPEIGFHIMHRIAVELASKLRANNLNIREFYLFNEEEDITTPEAVATEFAPGTLTDVPLDRTDTGD